jgi:hypothetical protein
VTPYEYLATEPDLPPPDERRPHMRSSPMMDSDEMTAWLNRMAGRGWEFVGYGQKQWNGRAPQEWWIFRRPPPPSTPKQGEGE